MLFRDEVTRRRASALFGETALTRSRWIGALTGIALVLSTALVSVLWLGTYERKQRVIGYIEPSKGLVRVIPPRAGTLLQVDVSAGDRVRAHEPLFTLSSPTDIATGTAVEALVVDRLLEERVVVERRLMQERRTAASARGHAERQARLVAKQIATTRSQRATAARRVDLLHRDIERLEALRERGHVPVSLLDARLGDLLDAKQQAHAIDREIRRLESEHAAFEEESHRIPLELESLVTELRSRVLALDRGIASAEAEWSQVVRAPVSGHIAAVLAKPGITVGPGRPVIEIVPAGSHMQAELLIPSYAAGFVHENQRVRIRLDAYPYQKFGVHGGTIVSLSRSVLAAESQQGPVRIQEPAYSAVVALDSEAVEVYGRSIPLQPGLTLQADVIRDRRRILEWLFDPVLATATRL